MAGKILPNTGNAPHRFKAALSALGTAIFWVIAATIFPYPVLIPYWPEGVFWAPLALYFLAFLNLIRAIYHASRAVRMPRANPSARNQPISSSARSQEGVRARKVDRAERNSRAAMDDGRNRTLPQISRPPTVKRMR